MDRIKFKLNGKKNSVGSEACSDMTLLDFIRGKRQLHGTKYMCREAGCGACIVTAVTAPGATPVCVNACVVPILSCHDWEITTIEKVGNRKDGYHSIQLEFAKQNASQCGYCTPGWIMNMYSYVLAKKKLTMLETEQAFGSNICRCTGYRPILDALKSFSSDATIEKLLPDIEDLKICSKTESNFSEDTRDENDWCIISNEQPGILKICLKDNRVWFVVRFVFDIFQILKHEGSDSYMLIHGNTGRVPYPLPEYPRILIDIRKVDEMQTYVVDQNLIVGAGVTITKLIDIFETVAKQEYFTYLQKLCEHIKLVAHVPVRNIGSLGGNLMIKHQHNEFPSDIYLLLETVGADLTIVNNGGSRQIVTMQQFLEMNMKGKVLLNALLPPMSENYKLVTYKIMPRAQSVHATVNAGFLYKLSSNNTVLTCRIVYGNLSPSFNRAIATENFLLGKNLFVNDTLQSALKVLEKELVVTDNPPEASAKFRKQLAVNLFYKGLLFLCPVDRLHPRFVSGAIDIRASRPVTQARQVYETNESLWPLNQPIEKVEGLIQSAGEAQYTDDIPTISHEVYVSYVVTSVATGTIVHIDPNKALKHPGVISFFSAKDIPGVNSFTPAFNIGPFTADEEVFCDGIVKYLNQPLGIIVAKTQKIARDASKLVEVTYVNVKPPVIDIKEAVKDLSKVTLYSTHAATDKGIDVAKVINHNTTIYGQYHFTLETIVCVTRPTEEGLKVFLTTQWPDAVQLKISQALKVHENRIDVSVRRIGGGYGLKVTRPGMTAVACSLAAYKLNRPCRFVQSMQDNMRSMGKRLPSMSNLEFAVNNSGIIQYSYLHVYEDNGYKINENFYLFIDAISNCYNKTRWSYNCYNVITDTPKNTFCRSPGTLEWTAMAEFKMERIAYELSLDPLNVRLANLDPQYNELRQIIETIQAYSDYHKRRDNVKVFNASNRWKKRGLRIVPLRWTPAAAGIMEVMIAIYHGDGTVSISHGGIEMGQGINTKATQICAYLLNIPLDKIQIKATNTISTANSFVSGASLTSENVCSGIKNCCQIILKRLAPIRSQLKNPTWEEVVTKAYESNVSLIAHSLFRAQDFQLYNVYGVTVAEVEIDVLTGECEVKRVDLMEDVGQSVNPSIDIGQIEGAFIMGLGYWTCEKLVYSSTGELLTDRAWNYHVPQAKDIPQDFRVYMRKRSYSNDSAFGSKCVGEPPICMSVVIPLAIREAISSARLDAGIPTNQWFSIDGPYSLESIGLATETKSEHMTYY